MKYRVLGRTGLKVSEIGYGSWGIGGRWGELNDDESILSLEKAIEKGVNFFDTALRYGNGHSEQLIGKTVKNIRDKVIIASKIPPKNLKWPVTLQDSIKDTFPSDWIMECTEKSLKNLGTEYLDVQQLHAWTDAYVNNDELFEVIEKLKRQGKIRYFGISVNDWDPYGAIKLVESEKVDTIQVIYNIFEQRPNESLLPAALKNNLGVIVRVVFEEGLLTGAIKPDYEFEDDDWRKNWLSNERLLEVSKRLEKLRKFLSKDKPTLAALALKFSLSHPAVSTVIPGMRKVRHVENNCSVSDGILLSNEEIEELKKHQFIHGWSYPWAHKKQ